MLKFSQAELPCATVCKAIYSGQGSYDGRGVVESLGR